MDNLISDISGNLNWDIVLCRFLFCGEVNGIVPQVVGIKFENNPKIYHFETRGLDLRSGISVW